MDVGPTQMQRSLADYRNSLLREGVLDSQYLQLQELQDESNPGFVVEVLSLFLTDSEKLLHDLSTDLIGTPRLKNACIAFRNLRNSCQEKNIPGYLKCLEQMRQEFFLVKSKLETLFNLEQQVVAAGAPRVKNACIAFQNFCQEKNIRGCLRCLQQMKQEFVLVKSKLEALFELEQQVVAAGGSLPKMQPINPSV
ncbi:hypothetical protein NL676_020868 [Syzygium grande]|nr:hypothetical protein NL676_020868 [Syzygium grande]